MKTIIECINLQWLCATHTSSQHVIYSIRSQLNIDALSEGLRVLGTIDIEVIEHDSCRNTRGSDTIIESLHEYSSCT